MARLNLELAPAPQPPAWLAADTVDSINTALNSKQHTERWKYTKTQPVLSLVAAPAAALPWANLPPGASVTTYTREQARAPMQPSIQEAPEACSALCYQDDLQVVEIGKELEEAIDIAHAASSAPTLLRVAPGAQLDLREQFDAGVDQQQTLWIELGAGSSVVHSRNSFGAATHWQFLHVTLGRDARYELHNHSGGAQLRRQDIRIVCAEPGAQAAISSAAWVAPGNHLDQQVSVEHAAPHTTSTQAFHNIAGDAANVTFNGRIHIHPGANGVDAQLSNKNLGLGTRAVINTKPELEIYNDDVKCAHGATVGQIDDNHLFYCASRGIGPERARSLLSEAFLNVCTAGPLAEQARVRFVELAHG